MSERSNLITLVVGSPKVGKTTYISELVKKYRKKVLIIDINSEKLYKDYPVITPEQIRTHTEGVARIINEDHKTVLSLIDRYFYNGLVVFEDATVYAMKATENPVKNLLVNYRHRNRDYIFTFHSLRRIPPFIFEMANYITLFRTAENVVESKGKIPEFPVVAKAFEAVKKSKDQYCKITVQTRP